MNEKVKKALLELLKAVLAAVAGFATALLTSSCGALTRATIRNQAENVSTTVTITTNNPTNFDINPSLDAEVSIPDTARYRIN